MLRRDLLKRSLATTMLVALFGCAHTRNEGPKEASGSADLVEQAFLYGFALHEFSRTAASSVKRSRPRNMLGRQANLLDHTARAVTAPNSDTIYASAYLELSGGPIEIVTPDAPDRYHSIAFMNAFTDHFAVLGTRTTGGRAGRYWVVGPDWAGQPPSGVELIRSDTNDVWMLARFLVEGPDDLAAAREVQSRFILEPVPQRGPVRDLIMEPQTASSPSHFLDVINELLGRSPVTLGQARRAGRFRDVGIRPGETGVWNTLPAKTREEWSVRFPEMLDRLGRQNDYLLAERNGWRGAPAEVGNFGENDALRAGVARWALAALPSEEATYFRSTRDSKGELLDGANAYQFRIPAEGVPVDSFWSMTIYREYDDGRFFMVDNPISRYAIGDRTSGLVKDADGSILIHIQPEVPDGMMAANWLPAPQGRVMLFFRAYLPRSEIRENRWSPPALVRSAQA